MGACRVRPFFGRDRNEAYLGQIPRSISNPAKQGDKQLELVERLFDNRTHVLINRRRPKSGPTVSKEDRNASDS